MKILTAALVLLAMQSPFGESIEVRLHNLDVIVTDREGKPVTGLRQEDFEVLEDGVPQKITNFAEYSERVARTPASAQIAVDAQPAVQAPPPRRFVFFVDEMAIHPNIRADLAKRSTDLLDRVMREGDQGMLVRPVISGKVTHAFTSDRAALRGELTTAIADNEWSADVAFRGELMRFQSDAKHAVSVRDRIMIARRHAARVKRRVEQRLSYLRGIVASLAPLPGRKVLVIVTES
ncbi:MAG TPA: VWA domain-containing protein, partial [Thermoanaerobaculia bacterium]|nr:VWA domain-containing protein [Thermoanaerobaculia bacterium]